MLAIDAVSHDPGEARVMLCGKPTRAYGASAEFAPKATLSVHVEAGVFDHA